MLLCNVELLILRITGHFNNLHTVQKRLRNILHCIGRRNEKHLRQIHREFHIVIPEFAVLFTVQHLQKCRRGISLVVTADLVDLIQKHQRIFYSYRAKPRYNTSRHCTDIGSAVSADLRLIPHAAQTYADVFLVQRSCNGAGDTGLTGSRRSHQTDDRALALAGQIPHCKELNYTLFDLLKTIMILVQNLLGMRQILIIR